MQEKLIKSVLEFESNNNELNIHIEDLMIVNLCLNVAQNQRANAYPRIVR